MRELWGIFRRREAILWRMDMADTSGEGGAVQGLLLRLQRAMGWMRARMERRAPR